MIDSCPACGVNLIIRKDTFRRVSRVVGIEVPDGFYGMLYWRCPDCGHCWHRWPEGSAAYELANRHMKEQELRD